MALHFMARSCAHTLSELLHELLTDTSPQGLTVSCKNCTTQGTIDLLEGSFTLNTSDDTSNDVEDIALFFNSGYIELVVNDFLAHIELESTIQPSASLILYTAPLPEIGIPGFQVITSNPDRVSFD